MDIIIFAVFILCMAGSVPRAMLDVGPEMLPLAFFLWLVPLWWILRERKRKIRKG